MDPKYLTLSATLTYFGILSLIVSTGAFDHITTQDGLDHYAEQPWYFLMPYVSESVIAYFPMPANLLVNVGYLVVPCYWLNVLNKEEVRDMLGVTVTYFYVFVWSAVVYMPVQTVRILTQNHRYIGYCCFNFDMTNFQKGA
eukprot:TRINITY_DN2154_c3_g1_i2.p1 TRINITY_DN2154_c3_g1~~TRINITY_DN2154_c3_g1_i2.p1  ORF type:complete len:141 (+),score=8.33 TRINITY_DN2154_c3_g1_i2:308-730(+)